MEPSWHVLWPEPAGFGPAPGRKGFAYERVQRFFSQAIRSPAAPQEFPSMLPHLTRGQGNARHTDLFLALARLGNVVRSLHTHQCIHLDSEGLLDAERHFP